MSFRRTPLTVGALVLVGLGLSAQRPRCRQSDGDDRSSRYRCGDPRYDARPAGTIWSGCRRRPNGSGSCSCSCRPEAPTNVPTEFTELAPRARASATTRSSSPTATRRRSRRCPPRRRRAAGPRRAPPAAPPNCAVDARTEILDGRGDRPSSTSIGPTASRTGSTSCSSTSPTTLPAEGWAQFLDASGAEPQPNWSKTVIAGSSLGAGEAVLIGSATHVLPRARCCTAGRTPSTAGSRSARRPPAATSR